MDRRARNSNGYYYDSDYREQTHIQHPVSRFDTLAGIAIKYGVEVADIKKMNGLSTDLQMFALKTLRIPLPGKHPPSTILLNGTENPGQTGYDQTANRHGGLDLFASFHSLRPKSTPERSVSPAMSSLQGYYGLKPTNQRPPSEGFEMMIYRKGEARFLTDDPAFSPSPSYNFPLDSGRKSRSLANFIMAENGELVDNINSVNIKGSELDKLNERLIRRHQKAEAYSSSVTPEMLLEDNSSGIGFSATRGKGLALRPKAASRTTTAADTDGGGLNSIPLVPGDSIPGDLFSGVRKSSSASSLQDQDANSSSSIWPTSKWSLKPDLQALSNVAIAKPIFDGLSMPISGRRNKAAID